MNQIKITDRLCWSVTLIDFRSLFGRIQTHFPRMAWYKCRSVFDMARIINFGLIAPDLTITKSGQAKTKFKDYAIYISFQLYVVLCIFFAFYTDSILISGSRALDIGITVPYKIGLIAVFIGKFILFARRHEMWKIYLLLNRCDKEVRKCHGTNENPIKAPQFEHFL